LRLPDGAWVRDDELRVALEKAPHSKENAGDNDWQQGELKGWIKRAMDAEAKLEVIAPEGRRARAPRAVGPNANAMHGLFPVAFWKGVESDMATLSLHRQESEQRAATAEAALERSRREFEALSQQEFVDMRGVEASKQLERAQVELEEIMNQNDALRWE